MAKFIKPRGRNTRRNKTPYSRPNASTASTAFNQNDSITNNPEKIVEKIVDIHTNEYSNYDPFIESLRLGFFNETLPNKQYAICLLYILKKINEYDYNTLNILKGFFTRCDELTLTGMFYITPDNDCYVSDTRGNKSISFKLTNKDYKDYEFYRKIIYDIFGYDEGTLSIYIKKLKEYVEKFKADKQITINAYGQDTYNAMLQSKEKTIRDEEARKDIGMEWIALSNTTISHVAQKLMNAKQSFGGKYRIKKNTHYKSHKSHKSHKSRQTKRNRK